MHSEKIKEIESNLNKKNKEIEIEEKEIEHVKYSISVLSQESENFRDKRTKEIFSIFRNILSFNKEFLINVYFTLFKQEEKNEITNEEIKLIIEELFEKLENQVFFAKMPENIHGFASIFLKIYLRMNYFSINKDEKIFVAISIINFLHEVAHYIRRKKFSGHDAIKINTPQVKNSLDESINAILNNENKAQFQNNEFGGRLEIFLFGRLFRYIYSSEVKFLLTLSNKKFVIEEFQHDFSEIHKKAKISNQNAIKFRRNSKEGEYDRGYCYYAMKRKLYLEVDED